MKTHKKPHIQQVISDKEENYYVKRYKARTKRKQTIFDRNGH